MEQINIENKLDLPHQDGDGKLAKILAAHLKLRHREQEQATGDLADYWSPEFFQLHRSKLFQESTPEQKQNILARCARSLLNEAYFVEKSGLAYCAKMVLKAETTEMAQVYSQIISDEATHLEWISPFVSIEDRVKPEGLFLKFLSSLIGECDYQLLTYLVQIILEGWGLQHYRHLSDGCAFAPLKKVFGDIVRDEALHHYTGQVLFDYTRTSQAERNFIKECLITYAEMVRVGPLSILNACDEALGGITSAQKKQLKEDILGYETSLKKLQVLRGLMNQPGLESTIQELDGRGLFIPQ